MKTMEVPAKQWGRFCRRLTQFCRGAMATIELETGDLKTTIARDLPLRELALDEKSDPCSTHLVIEAGAPESKPARHVVLEPIRIHLRNGHQDNRYHTVQISAENGTTLLELRPGLDGALLKELSG